MSMPHGNTQLECYLERCSLELCAQVDDQEECRQLAEKQRIMHKEMFRRSGKGRKEKGKHRRHRTNPHPFIGEAPH